MNTNLLYTLVCCCIAMHLNAQQLPLLSQFQESAGVLNPASLSNLYFRYEHNTVFTGTHHSQWTELEGNPRTSQLVAESFLDDYGPVAPLVGVYFISDQTGPTGLNGLYAKIGGVLSDDPYEYGLAAALQVGINQYRLRISDLRLREQEVIYAAENDNTIQPDVGLGVFAYKRFGDAMVFGGVSAPQVFGLDLSFNGNDGEITTQRYQHYYGQLGAVLGLADESFLEPTIWIKHTPGVPTNVSANLNYQTPTALFIGMGATTARSMNGLVGVMIGDREGYGPMMRIGYSFDYSFTVFGPYSGSAHEINLTYSLAR